MWFLYFSILLFLASFLCFFQEREKEFEESVAQSGEPVVSTVHFQHNVACLSVCHLLYLSYSIYLSLLSVCLFVSLPLCLSIHHLFIYLSFYPFIYLSTCLFAYLPLCAYFSLSHSIYLTYLSPSIHLSLPSAYLPTSNYMCT